MSSGLKAGQSIGDHAVSDGLNPFEPIQIIRRIGDAFHAYTWKHNYEWGSLDRDEGVFRGDENQENLLRLQELRPQWVQAAVRVGRPAYEANRAFGQLLEALFDVRKAFHGLHKFWHNWKDNPYNGSLSTLAGHLGLRLTASEEEVKQAAEANNAPIRAQVHRLIEDAIAITMPFAQDIAATTPVLESTEPIPNFVPAKSQKKKKRSGPGNPGITAKERAKRLKLYEAWKASGSRQKQFARDRGFFGLKDEEEALAYLECCRKTTAEANGVK